MSLITDKLSAMKPGSHVRFTNVAGQIIDGIVIENDGKESLSVQITMSSTLRYDQVGMIDLYANDVISQPIVLQDTTVIESAESKPNPVQIEKPAGIEITKVRWDKDAISRAFKVIDSDKKKLLTSAYSKFQSGLKDHDNAKCKEAIDLIVRAIKANVWEHNPEINCFLALLYMANGEVAKAAETFLSGNDAKSAYCSIYKAAQDKDDKELYRLAAAFAVVYLSDCKKEETAEPLEVLKTASVLSEDISGIEYVLTDLSFDSKRDLIINVLRDIAKRYVKDNAEDASLDVLIRGIRVQFTGNEVGELAKKYIVPKTKAPDIKPVENLKPEIEVSKEPDVTKVYGGKIVKYNFYESTGKIECENGECYPFDIKDITDVSLKEQVKKMTLRTFHPVLVRFMITKMAGKYIAVSIKYGLEPAWTQSVKPQASKTSKNDSNTISSANLLYTQRDYNEALKIYKEYMESDDWENAFSQIIMCYLALSKEDDEHGHMEELKAFVDKYVGRTIKNSKTLEVMFSYYMKANNYSEAINVINELVERCDESEHGRMLHYLSSKARCYRFLQDYPNAIGELLDWLEIVKRNKMTERTQQRDTLIYIELAELYFECGEYENAEKYANLSESVERKSFLIDKLSVKKAEIESLDGQTGDTDGYYERDEDIDSTLSENDESLRNVYDEYKDPSCFVSLGIDDVTVLNTVKSFKPEQLYCLLTYLNTAAALAADSPQMRLSDSGEIIKIGNVKCYP